VLNEGTAKSSNSQVEYNDETSVRPTHDYDGNGSRSNFSNSSPFVFANTDRIWLSFKVPIQGWSSNTIMSEDLGGREVVVRGAGNGGEALTASVTDINFTETRDTSSSWNGSQFTAPESGDYSLVGMVYTTAATDTQLRAYIDGALESIIGNSASIFRPFSDIVKLEKGQVLSLRLDNNLTLANNSAIHHIHIQKLASPQTILATETVAASFKRNDSYTHGASATTQAKLKFETTVFDTHNAVPVSGNYRASVDLCTTSGTGSSSYFDTSLIMGSTTYTGRDYLSEANAIGNSSRTGTATLNKGDVITVSIGMTYGGTASTLNPALGPSFLCIERIK
jgi:hypothetical protein